MFWLLKVLVNAKVNYKLSGNEKGVLNQTEGHARAATPTFNSARNTERAQGVHLLCTR